jgi:hypothetical protein
MEVNFLFYLFIYFIIFYHNRFGKINIIILFIHFTLLDMDLIIYVVFLFFMRLRLFMMHEKYLLIVGRILYRVLF